MKRLAESARFFGFTFDESVTRATLENYSLAISERAKVRLVLSRNGSIVVEVQALGSSTGRESSLITFADETVVSTDNFLYHKTSNRELYRRELEKKPDCVDVIFINERNEVTEGANNNIVIRKDGMLLTPPVICGLLPGTLRGQLLEKGEISERVLFPADLEQADEIYLINSVRKWRQVRLAKKSRDE
jgi:para-aminobenzoate synthetase/4-amino-4-deoxychorismate lyase